MWYTLSVFFPLLAVTMILTMGFRGQSHFTFEWIDLISLVPYTLMMIALFNKDFFGGQSVVHRQLGYKVLDVKTNETATKIQCFVRNLIGPVWPIEVILILVNPKRRLGDIVAGTMLVDVPASNPELILTEIKVSKFDRQTILTLLLSVISLAIFMILFDPRINLW